MLGALAARPDCRKEIFKAAEDAFGKVDPDAPGRTSNMPIKPDSPEPGPEPGPEPKPVPRPPAPGFRVTGCRSETICFEKGQYDEKEYRRQLKVQQSGINGKTACKNKGDIDRFDRQTPAEKLAQRARATAYKNSTFLPAYRFANPGVSLDGKDALHRIDMVAGGYETDFADVGDSGVNRSVGAEWPADSRKGQFKRYADEMCQTGCRMSVTLDICEVPPSIPNYDEIA